MLVNKGEEEDHTKIFMMPLWIAYEGLFPISVTVDMLLIRHHTFKEKIVGSHQFVESSTVKKVVPIEIDIITKNDTENDSDCDADDDAEDDGNDDTHAQKMTHRTT